MQKGEVRTDGFFLSSSVSRHDSSFHPGWGPSVSAGSALCLPLYLTNTHARPRTLTHTNTRTRQTLLNSWFCKAPATAHEICLYHLVAVKVLVWTTVPASDPQPIKLKTQKERERERQRRERQKEKERDEKGEKSAVLSFLPVSQTLHVSVPMFNSPKVLFCASRLSPLCFFSS